MAGLLVCLMLYCIIMIVVSFKFFEFVRDEKKFEKKLEELMTHKLD